MTPAFLAAWLGVSGGFIVLVAAMLRGADALTTRWGRLADARATVGARE